MNKLTPIITVDEDKCNSCHSCIAACPVKYCNDAIGDSVVINENLCIGCGQCVRQCLQDARILIDDFDRFIQDSENGTKIVAVVAPAVAASFPHQYLQLNNWLKRKGVKAVFDVSFGAELTIRSYLEHLKSNPKSVISQPCPAIVTYIEIYQPELLPYLAPADSPMVHTMKMIREYYPEYSNCKFAIISPCAAKKREFDDTIGDYNVTMTALKTYFEKKGINLSSLEAEEYDNPPAERGVLFSSPGGLMETAARWNPEIINMTRKIEGPESIYEYLKHLPESIKAGYQPLLIDCLNCEMGCNGGPATGNLDKPQDIIEHLVRERANEQKEKLAAKGFRKQSKKTIEKCVESFWKPGLYDRTYSDKSSNYRIKIPSAHEKQKIYESMLKFTQDDEYNCRSCGYGSCESMAVAIHNNLNNPENCHHYLKENSDRIHEKFVEQSEETLLQEQQQKNTLLEGLKNIQQHSADLISFVESIREHMNELTSTTEHISAQVDETVTLTNSGVSKAAASAEIIATLESKSDEIDTMVNLIRSTSENLGLLALNATIEAATAGDAGKGFAVVASEVKSLAKSTGIKSEEIKQQMESMHKAIATSTGTILEISQLISTIQEFQHNTAAAITQQASSTGDVDRQIQTMYNSFDELNRSVDHLYHSFDMNQN